MPDHLLVRLFFSKLRGTAIHQRSGISNDNLDNYNISGLYSLFMKFQVTSIFWPDSLTKRFHTGDPMICCICLVSVIIVLSFFRANLVFSYTSRMLPACGGILIFLSQN